MTHIDRLKAAMEDATPSVNQNRQFPTELTFGGPRITQIEEPDAPPMPKAKRRVNEHGVPLSAHGVPCPPLKQEQQVPQAQTAVLDYLKVHHPTWTGVNFYLHEPSTSRRALLVVFTATEQRIVDGKIVAEGGRHRRAQVKVCMDVVKRFDILNF